MEISPVAFFRSPLTDKFGIPRQSGLVPQLPGRVVFEPKYAHPEALRGLDGFDYLWLVWGFDRNAPSDGLTVRPPRLGGNARVGVFASRSPFRPNGLGLSSVRIKSIDFERCEISVLGADLADGTPIYDVKPYVEYADSHPGVKSGFVDESEWTELEVRMTPESVAMFSSDELASLKALLSQDPRPRYQNDPEKLYGMSYSGRNVRFRVSGRVLEVLEVTD